MVFFIPCRYKNRRSRIQKITLQPADIADIDYKFSYRTPYGNISVSRNGEKFYYKIPDVIKYELHLPPGLTAIKN